MMPLNSPAALLAIAWTFGFAIISVIFGVVSLWQGHDYGLGFIAVGVLIAVAVLHTRRSKSSG